MKSSREIYTLTGITRKTLRGYVSLGLLVPEGKNARGGWIFSDEAVVLVHRIRNFQSMGFTLREMSDVLSMSDGQLREALQEKIKELQMQEDQVREKILCAQNALRKLEES